MTENLEQIEEILYDGLSSLEDPQTRGEFLDLTCQGNPDLRARLEKLLSMRDGAERFFGVGPEPAAFALRHEDEETPDAEFKEGLGTRIGRYRLLERLGEGGCGAVYLAEQLEPVRRRVALKIIRMGISTASVMARFDMERQALALMDHPNIARVLDAGATASGRPFFVMQLVEGLRITDFCDRNRLGIPARLELFILVCRAIQHAHQKGIIHCDIKPSNVMVTLHDGVAVPKVIDFGIAKATEGGLPDVSVSANPSPPLVGTPAYMSPEQLAGDPMDVDTRSDIYSLGVLLYELLAGKPPRDREKFDQSSPEEIRRLLLDEPAPRPSDRLSSCPAGELETISAARGVEPARLIRLLRGDLDAVIMKAMESDRQRRYATASGLAADLSNHLHDEPVQARGTGRGYRLGKLVRRNKVVFAAGTIVALALVGGLGTSTWLFYQEARARQEQERLRQVAEVARANEVSLRERAQAGETVAHAAVLISHGDIAQADGLLAAIKLDNVPASLESASTFRAAGEWLLRENRWEDASTRFAAVAQAISRADRSESESISIHFVAAAAAVAESGNSESYERLRQMAADRFFNTRDPVIADEVVKACLIMPATPELLAKLAPLLKVVSGNFPWDRIDAPQEVMEAWQLFSLSLAAYRKGDYQIGVEWAERCLIHPNQISSRTVGVRIIHAMELHQLGREEKARAELETARAGVDAHFREPFQVQLGWTEDGLWFDWVIARILLKEADGVMPR